MSINYENLRESSSNLRTMFFNYYEHVLNFQTELLKLLKKKEIISQPAFDQLMAFEERSNYYEAEIMDECGWIISKDSPRANHLRFVIAIMKSSGDLERMSDYAINIAYYIKNQKTILVDVWDMMIELWEKSIDISRIFFNNLKSVIKSTLSFYEQSLDMASKYQTSYATTLHKLSAFITSSNKKKSVSVDPVLTLLIFKNIERNVDHSMGIVENFVYIRESTFFFEKKHKQFK